MRNGVSRLLVVSACAVGVAAGVPLSASAAEAPAAASQAPGTTGSWSFQAALGPIGAGDKAASGASWITVTGSHAEFKIQVKGLLDGQPHPQMLFVDGKGGCPATLPDAGDSAVGGAGRLGSIGLAVTTAGRTAPGSATAEMAFPTAGSYTYARTIELDPAVVAGIADGTAALVVYGVDKNNNGRLDGAAGRSELGAGLTAEAATPALCGRYTPMQMAGVPDGAAETGGGSTAAVSAGVSTGGDGPAWAQLVAGALSVLGVAVLSGRRLVRTR